MSARLVAAGIAAIVATAAGCGDDLVPPIDDATPGPDASPTSFDGPPVLVGAGDIGGAWFTEDEATAALLDAIDGTIFTAGDNAYPRGSAEDFAEGFDPSWGRHKGRIRPAPGNHDYMTAGAAAYFDYFGAAAGEPGRGYYSYDLGDWHIVVLDTNKRCTIVPCEAGSEQLRWLRRDLMTTRASCVAAIAHAPRFSSGHHGDSPELADLFGALYDHGVDLFIAGHDHDYERFAPLDPHGARDDERGVVQFVVGTGGTHLRPFRAIRAHSLSRNDQVHGVLELTLHPGAYEWRFVGVPGGRFKDAGRAACRG